MDQFIFFVIIIFEVDEEFITDFYIQEGSHKVFIRGSERGTCKISSEFGWSQSIKNMKLVVFSFCYKVAKKGKLFFCPNKLKIFILY